MEDFLKQIEQALEFKLYYIALQSVLTLPDICSNLVNTDPNVKVIDRYSAWYDTYVKNDGDMISGETCYRYRCSNLHQGTLIHAKSKFDRVLFVAPNSTFSFYNCAVGYGNEICYLENLEVFCNNIITAVRNWLPTVENDETFKANYAKLVKTYPDVGLANIPIPFIS